MEFVRVEDDGRRGAREESVRVLVGFGRLLEGTVRGEIWLSSSERWLRAVVNEAAEAASESTRVGAMIAE